MADTGLLTLSRSKTNNGPTSRILLVEDETALRETLAYNLVQAGYEVEEAADGETALMAVRARLPDLLVLDLMLPKLDGLSLCRAVRLDWGGPILMLTARSGEMDKIIGLETGADDYMTKPFSLGEFLARVRALLRRLPNQPISQLVSGDLVLDLVSRRATAGGHELLLSPKEFSLLAELMRHKGAVLSRDLLLTRVWGYDFYGDSRTVDVHVRWLREKLELDPSKPERIHTVRGIGYSFEG